MVRVDDSFKLFVKKNHIEIFKIFYKVSNYLKRAFIDYIENVNIVEKTVCIYADSKPIHKSHFEVILTFAEILLIKCNVNYINTAIKVIKQNRII